MLVPVMPAMEKTSTELTDVIAATQLVSSPSPITAGETTSLPPQINVSGLKPIIETTEEDKIKTAPQLLKVSITEEPTVVERENQSKNSLTESSLTESSLKEPAKVIARTDISKTDRQSSPPPPIMTLNAPISPEGSSRKENVPDNVRNNCATELTKPNPTAAMLVEEGKSVDLIEHQQTDTTTAEIPMKKLEKLVDQQQQMLPIAVSSNHSPSALPLPKKHTGAGESKLNLSIKKLIMKNKNASAAAKFVPTLQQMQQIGMHTSIPSFQQQQQQPCPSPYPNACVRPGFPGMHPFKRIPDAVPVRSQVPTNRLPLIPMRKSYEWNKARSLAAKPLPSTAVKDNKTNEKQPMMGKDNKTGKDNKMNEKPPIAVIEKLIKKSMADKPPATVVNTCLSSKNSDEMNAAQSLLKVGQDLRLLKPQNVTDLHDKYNCESSLQITKVTETESNQPPAAHDNHSNSQPSLQIMRMPQVTETLTKSVATTETSNSTNSGTTVATPNKPVNKKPVPSLYSMPTKRTKEEAHTQHNNVTENKRIERRVDTENGVLSVSLLTETTKQDMDAKRREVVQPDVSIKLMTFATESVKKAPELSPIASGNCNNKKKVDELNPTVGASSKRKLDELNLVVGSGTNSKRKLDELNPFVIGGANNKRKFDELNPMCGGSTNKRKQDEPERKVTPPRLAPTKDDVPQLIEINSSPYAKLLPAKKQQHVMKQQAVVKQQHASKQQPVAKPQSTTKQQPTSKLQPVTKVLDLSKSPPNGGLKRLAATDASGNCSPPNTSKQKTTSPLPMAPSPMSAAGFDSNLLFAAHRYLLKQHFETLNNGLMRNSGKGPDEWPRVMYNPPQFARPPTNLNN